jgi:hypothetical protein
MEGFQMASALVGFLVWAFCVAVGFYVCKLLLAEAPLPPLVKTIAWLILGVVAVLMLLYAIGFLGGAVVNGPAHLSIPMQQQLVAALPKHLVG